MRRVDERLRQARGGTALEDLYIPTRKCSGGDRFFYEPGTDPQLKILRRFSVETGAFLAGLGERPVASPIGAAELR